MVAGGHKSEAGGPLSLGVNFRLVISRWRLHSPVSAVCPLKTALPWGRPAPCAAWDGAHIGRRRVCKGRWSRAHRRLQDSCKCGCQLLGGCWGGEEAGAGSMGRGIRLGGHAVRTISFAHHRGTCSHFAQSVKSTDTYYYSERHVTRAIRGIEAVLEGTRVNAGTLG